MKVEQKNGEIILRELSQEDLQTLVSALQVFIRTTENEEAKSLLDSLTATQVKGVPAIKVRSTPSVQQPKI